MGVIIAFDIIEDGKFYITMILVDKSVCPFVFNCFEKALSHCIIPTIAFSAHTLSYQIVLGNQLGELVTGILHSSIRMKD